MIVSSENRPGRPGARLEGGLFSPLGLREATLRNRCVISPMQIYAACADGRATDWHFQHLAKFAVGGAGAVMTEALAVDPCGRNTYADLGIWEDAQVAPLSRIAAFLKANGAVAGAQLHHSGPRGSRRRPWDGLGPLDESDLARGEAPWLPVGPDARERRAGLSPSHPLSIGEIARLVDRFAAAARRCAAADFDMLEVHAGHDYLIHSFLSPRLNARTDAYGGSLERRMRLALEVAEAVRSHWPAGRPLAFRISCVDRDPGGWGLDDAVTLARRLASLGVDLIDCSSSGTNDPSDRGRAPALGFQVPYAARLRADARVPTMAVGLIVAPHQADAIIRSGSADLVAVGREALFNPHWPLHAARALGADAGWRNWPACYGWWLDARERTGMADGVGQLDPKSEGC